jgi:hypothetical protein
MIWHIFMKDCRLLWRGIAAAAAAHAINAGLWAAAGTFEIDSGLAGNAYLASVVALVGMLMLVAAAVHQDTPAATNQDWIVRPIRRRDLLLAKVLFAVVAAHGPLLLCDTIEGLAHGFPLLQSIGAALTRGAAIFLSMSLPAMLLATLTRSMTGWLGATMTVLIALALATLGAGMGLPSPPSYARTGFGWIATWLTVAVTALAAAIALPLRYAKRELHGVLAIGLTALILIALASSIPWKASLAIQRWTAAEPNAGRTIALDFEAEVARAWHDGDGVVVLNLPLHVSGMPARSLLLIDNASIRLADAGGTTLYSSDNNCIKAGGTAGGHLDCARVNFRVPLPPGASEGSFPYPIGIPVHIYERVRQQAVKLEIDYYVSLLGLSDVGPLARQPGQEALYGGCAQRLNRDTGQVELRCLNSIAAPACVRLLGPNADNRRPFPDVTSCEPTYTPLAFSRFPDVLRRGERRQIGIYAGAGGRAYDRFYPRDESMVVETYSARNHLRLSSSIDSLLLAD